MGTYLTGTYSVIHTSGDADFDNFVYSSIYFNVAGAFIINGIVVIGVVDKSVDIIVNENTTTLSTDFLLLGNPIAPQTKVKTGLISGDSHNEVWEFVNIKTGLPARSTNGSGSPDSSPDTLFKMTIDTTKAGATNTQSYRLDLHAGATNLTVDWGDGNSDVITTYNQAELTHVYDASGTYQISLSGSFEGITSPNNNDRLKIMSIDNWGTIQFKNMNAAFTGCANMVGLYTDKPDTSLCTNMEATFNSCTLFNSNVDFDMSLNTDLEGFLYNATNFNQPINWVTPNVETFFRTFASMPNFNSPVTIDGFLSVTNVRGGCTGMFGFCNTFNSPLTFSDFSNVPNVNNMFNSSPNFNQDISDLDISGLLTCTECGEEQPKLGAINMLRSTSFSTVNYDLLLVAWDTLGTSNIKFHAGSAQYSSGAPATARANMVSRGWEITDGGQV